MKTRIVHTKIWSDDTFGNMSEKEKLLFLYLLTCEYNNLVGAFELPLRTISFHTGIPVPELPDLIKKLQDAGRAFFVGGWVWLKNAHKYNGYIKSSKVLKAYQEELKRIPEELKSFLQLNFPENFKQLYDIDMISLSYQYDTALIHNTETIKHKEGGSGGKQYRRQEYDEWETGSRAPSKPPYKLWSEAKDYADLRGEDREYMDNACYMGDKRLAPAGPPKGTPEKLVAEWRKVYARKYGTEVQPSNPAHAGN